MFKLFCVFCVVALSSDFAWSLTCGEKQDRCQAIKNQADCNAKQSRPIQCRWNFTPNSGCNTNCSGR